MPLTRPGLSLCPLFTVTVIRPMEAQQRGVCSHCPVQDCQPLSGHKLSQGLWVKEGLREEQNPGWWGWGVDLNNLAARIREEGGQTQDNETERDRGRKRKWEREKDI